MKSINVISKKIEWDRLEKEYDQLVNTLYPVRKEAVERLNNQKAKIVSLATGLLLQDIVYKELGIEPKDLSVSKMEQGKPYIDGRSEFYFNISHSGDRITIAYGNSSVGVDVEHIRCRESDLKVAKRCFTQEEYEFIALDEFALDKEGLSHSKEERFFMVWTMKEAYLKYTGTGISVPMKSFQVKPYDGVVVGEKLNNKTLIMEDYVYSVCVDDDVEISFSFE